MSRSWGAWGETWARYMAGEKPSRGRRPAPNSNFFFFFFLALFRATPNGAQGSLEALYSMLTPGYVFMVPSRLCAQGSLLDAAVMKPSAAVGDQCLPAVPSL